MNDLQKRLENLSPEKYELLLQKLKKDKRILPGKEAPQTSDIKPVSRDSEIPLSFAQRRLWFLDQLEGESTVYNLPFALRLTGLLHLKALKKSLNQIVQRHEVLRTNFADKKGRPVQIITPEIIIPLPVMDLRHLPGVERDAEVKRLSMQEAHIPFNLAKGPLIRATLLWLQGSEHEDADQEYVLLISIHHIVSDDWSLGILGHELSVLYEACITGRPSPLQPLPIQYADFASWQRQWLEGERFNKELDYWKNQLADSPRLLELPADRPRPAVQTFEGRTANFILGADLTRCLNLLSQRSGATLFMTLLAAFGVLLARYNGQEDIVIGSPIANRNRKEIEPLIGFFVNTLVLRIDMSGNPSFTTLLERVKQVALDAYAHQNLPFEQLVDELHPERNLSHTPLFQVMFILKNSSTSGFLKLSGLEIDSLSIETGRTHFDLVMCLTESDSDLYGVLEYSTDLFDRGTIARMIQHFQILLDGITADPDQRIWHFPVLSEADRRRILVEWNDTQRDYSYHECIHHLFESQARRTPDAPCLCSDGHLWSYGDLNARANQLAHLLRKKGVGPDMVVGLMMDRSPDMVLGILAILKAGGACLPIDPEYPEERILTMLNDSGAMLLLTKERLIGHLSFAESIERLMDNDGALSPGEVLELIPGLTFLPRRNQGAAREVLMLDRMEDALTGQKLVNPDRLNRGADLAYVLYTSGSTGKPKGVAMVHQAISNLILWHLDDERLSKKAKTVQFAPFTFDVFFQEIFSTWCSGGTLFLISEDTRRDAAALWRFLKEMDIERLFLPFVALHQLAEITQGSEDMPSNLRDVITAGEQLQITPAIAGLFERLRDCPLHNHYGPVETHVVTTFTLDGPAMDWPKLPPIGRPIPNTQIYILDRLGGPVPPGVPGELFIGGVALARGYLGRPSLTYKKFIPNPFSNDSESRLYRTGDLARWLPDGNIEYLGRMDNQVKIRGFRIEPGEIEAVLSGYPGVRETTVVAREYEPGDRRLVAYVVTDSGMQIAISDLRDFLKEKLPAYMVPSRFVMLAKLPLTSSGKVNRLALPEPDASPGGSEGNYVSPRTPVEELLTALWAEVLKVERIGIHDNFFDLGGHSLLATQLISRIRDAFSLELPIRRLFESPTIAELGKHIEAGEHKDMTLPIRPVEGDADLPLSFAQERLWFLTQFEGEKATYNMPAALKLTGHLDISALKQSFNEIIDRHESLRTVFTMKNGYPVQVILPAMTLPFVIKDLRELTDEKRLIEFQRLASEEAQCPFDLSSGPLVRIILFQLAHEEYVLLVNIHHIVFDGWSSGIFINELSISYNAFLNNTPALLPELTVQYADYACWQRERLTDEVTESHLNYWIDKLGNAPVEVLPIDLSPPEVRSYRGGIVNFEIDAVISRKLYDIGQKAGASFFMTLLSAFNALLFRLSGQEDIVVGVPIANRNRKEIEPLIGFFVNILPFRTNLSGKPPFQELLKRVRKVTLDAYAHHDFPFVKLVQALRPDRKLVRQPLYQVSFGLMNSTMGEPKLSGLDLKPLKLFSGMTPCDLFLSVTETDSGLMSFFAYDTDIFKSTTIAMLAEHFKMFLKGVVQDPECSILDVPLVRSSEVTLENRGTEPTLRDETDQFQF